MKIQVIKKKASSLRELERETVEIPKVSTLKEFLAEMVSYELLRSQKETENPVLKEQDITAQSRLGRVSFGVNYNENRPDSQKALEVMLQDFTDGLFRVFINGEEYLKLDDTLHMEDGDEVVFIRLVMLAGRMW
ncbi:hypothetical protein ABXS75_15315 [Roseburia hominis]